jgi:predicted outer membrane repeat protein
MLPVVTFENVKFINNSAVNGGALAISGATFNNVTFKDNSAKDMGGAIYLISVPNGLKSNIPDLIINDSLFENSSASQGKDIYISTPDSNSGIANVTGLTVTFNNLTTQFLADTVSASVSHISGAVIGGSSIKFYLNGTYMGTSGVVNGVASLDYLGFKNGVYNLSGDYVVAGARDKIINGTVKVALNALKDNVTIYVSDKLGDDVNGDGSLDKPFKTIKKALNYGYSQSTTLFVHILEGIYSGEGNTNIGLSSTVSVTITGAGVNKTILCGNQINDFFTVSAGTNIITIENMSMINGSKADAASVYPYTNVKNVHSPVIALPNSNVYLNNIYFENNKGNLGGAVLNSGNMKINNCSFVRNGFSSYGGGLTNNGTLIVDNSYFFANYAYRGANIFVIKDMTLQNSLVEESYWISGSHYGNIVGIDSGITLINTTVQNLGRTAGEAGRTDIQANRPGHIYFAGLNRVESYGCIFKYGESVAAGDIFGSFYGASWEYNWQDFIKFDNCSFINVKNIDSVGFRANLNRTGHVSLNNCILDIKGKVLTTSTFDILNITNCYIPDSSVVSWSSLNTPNAGIIDLNNNWWGSNTQPVFTIVSTNKTLVNMTPENWLVLTLDVTNKPGLLQDAVLTFKVFNGTNLTDYVGSLPVRDFNMSAANATLSVVNGTINNGIVNGFEAKEGNYTISATVDGQTVIYNGTASLGKGIINVTDSSLDYGEVVMVNATLVDTNGNGIANINMTLKVNGKTYYMVTDENGAVSFVIDPLDSGIYTLEFIVPASKVLSSVSNSSTLTINKAKDFIKADIDAGVAGEDVVIVVNGPKDLKENITVTVDKTNYNVVLVNGSASLTLKDLTAGNYDVTVSYPGDNNYYNQVIKTNFTVDINKKVNLNISDIVMIYKDGTRMIAVLTDYLGNPIANATLYFTINGKTYVKTTDDKGTASMGLNLVSKVYDATISYNGSDKYDAVSKNITVTINPTIISEDLVKMYQNATRFYAKFTDSTGKALANSEVRFNIHGVFYTKTTNKDGVADLGIMLRPGTYILTAYNPVTGEEKGFNITVKSLIVQNDLTKYYLNASRFQATIYNKDGSLAVNKEVTFNINGVFYTKTTDENGVASLGIALRPGSYIITTIFDGLAMGNNVVVIPTLVTKDLNMKYLDGSDFTAQTLNGQGKPLSNQNVSFNVNGVFYHKVTDENGIASLKIRLMSGEYIITSYWNDFQTGNTIKISP